MTNWGFNGLGYVVYKRTYARPIKDNKTEEWSDSIDRIIQACDKQLSVGFTKEEEQRLREYFTNLQGFVAGRFWWQLGTKTVERLGLASLQNCAAVAVDHPIRPFTWAMDMLMLGCGVGYNIQREYVYQLPKLKKKVKVTHVDSWDCDFIVPDNREGWCALLDRVLRASFESGQGFTYTTKAVRPSGDKIKSFGGTASGPAILIWGMDQINTVLNNRAGKKLRPIDCLDIMNIIGYIVVAGNVRRSAQLAIGDYDDELFLQAKRWDLGNIPNWRAMSNNSVACSDISKLSESFWDGYRGVGEAYGLINLKLTREIGRTGENRPDTNVIGFNPCAEQPLDNFETCCLAEIVLPYITNKEDLLDIAILLYKICKHSLALPVHHPETAEVINNNMRLGLGITGYMQATEIQREWLSETYLCLREFDKNYSALHNFPESIRLTTIKPSGTLSLLAGVTAGAHPGYSRYFLRRVRMSASSPLVEECRRAGYSVEWQQNYDGTIDHNTQIIGFPCEHPADTKLAEDMTALAQLEVVARLQKEWSDNAVSCTIYYRIEELPEIRVWLSKHFTFNIKTVSFLLHSDHGFTQAPLEQLTETEYNDRVSKITPISDASCQELDVIIEECATGACPIK